VLPKWQFVFGSLTVGIFKGKKIKNLTNTNEPGLLQGGLQESLEY